MRTLSLWPSNVTAARTIVHYQGVPLLHLRRPCSNQQGKYHSEAVVNVRDALMRILVAPKPVVTGDAVACRVVFGNPVYIEAAPFLQLSALAEMLITFALNVFAEERSSPLSNTGIVFLAGEASSREGFQFQAGQEHRQCARRHGRLGIRKSILFNVSAMMYGLGNRVMFYNFDNRHSQLISADRIVMTPRPAASIRDLRTVVDVISGNDIDF